MIYRIFRTYFRFALPAFYREIEVTGRDRVPDEGPLILVGNHNNAMLDPVIVAAMLERRVQLTAKSTLQRMPLLGAIMRRAGVIFLHRQQDLAEGADPRRNLAALAAIVDRLEEGAAVLIFPEGRSHGEPRLARFKSGAARVALAYVDGGAPAGDLRILPFGLWFEAKSRRRSRARLAFGRPISVGAWRAEHPGAQHRELTAWMAARVEALTLNFASEADMERLPALARVIEASARPPAPIGAPLPPPGRHLELVARLVEGRDRLAARDADRLARLESEVQAHLAALDDLGVRAEDLYLPRRPVDVLRFGLREGALVLIGLVPALWGILNWALPFWLTRLLVWRFSKDAEQEATWAVFAAALVYPCAALVQCSLAWWLLPRDAALVYVLALLPAGAFAQSWLDRMSAALRRARAFLRLGRHPVERQALAAEGRDLLTQLQQLAASLA